MKNLIVLSVAPEDLADCFENVERFRLTIAAQVGKDTEVITVPSNIEVHFETGYRMYSGSKTIGSAILRGTFQTNQELRDWLADN